MGAFDLLHDEIGRQSRFYDATDRASFTGAVDRPASVAQSPGLLRALPALATIHRDIFVQHRVWNFLCAASVIQVRHAMLLLFFLWPQPDAVAMASPGRMPRKPRSRDPTRHRAMTECLPASSGSALCPNSYVFEPNPWHTGGLPTAPHIHRRRQGGWMDRALRDERCASPCDEGSNGKMARRQTHALVPSHARSRAEAPLAEGKGQCVEWRASGRTLWEHRDRRHAAPVTYQADGR